MSDVSGQVIGTEREPNLILRLGSFMASVLRFIRGKPLGGFGLIIAVVFILVALLASVIERHDPDQIFEAPNPDYKANPTTLELARNPDIGSPVVVEQFAEPSGSHWFGTDKFGRDIWSQVVHGARLSLIVGLGASVIAVVGGLIIGMISAYYAGLLDLLIQRVVDMLQAIPFLVLVLVFTQITEPRVLYVVLWLGVAGLAITTRLIRSAVLGVRESEFVLAARVIGASDIRIMVRHVLPNVIAVLIIAFSIGIGAYILAEASISFLGAGPQGIPSWGQMVQAGRGSLDLHPWQTVFAGAAIMMIVLGFNLLGDALRDVLDPRLRGV
jgi:ABC-type dipeptide/oligopeptide/nickel transport system permease subunit